MGGFCRGLDLSQTYLSVARNLSLSLAWMRYLHGIYHEVFPSKAYLIRLFEPLDWLNTRKSNWLIMSQESRIYVGNLPTSVRAKDVEDIFSKYGKIVFVDLKDRRPPYFAFVEFEDARDAEDAVRSRDGYDYYGYRLRVEFPRGVGPRGPGGRPLYDRGGSNGGSASKRESREGGNREGGRSGGSGGRRTNYRVLVSGLPVSGSWQDLKDHMREAGDVCYADILRDGTGVVEYSRLDDMKYAIRKLDDTKFKSHEGETSYIRVREDEGHERSGSASRHRSRSPVGRVTRGSPQYSPRQSRSRSRSHSASRSLSRSASPV
ncbi:unnamed protein product [Anisakis simplex]|uniref:Serine/arginine-rich splicing factor 1 (inferred by orthology to a human protein) n=1 Tax=Anisakis simplex TaxID=6269 RepID=A0A0M3JXW4_ANISI|nr:unnamed protein product [Anisakis simplex]